MPKKKNLDLAAEMGEDVDVTEEEANDAAQIVPPPTEPVAPMTAASTQPITMTVADIQAIVTAAVSAASQGNAALADVVTQGIAQARKPIPEGTDASYPRISVFNPLGERDHPRPGLKCDFFIGTQDPKTKLIARTYPLLDDDLTAAEQVALNILEPMAATVQRTDGESMKVQIVAEHDPATDALMRMVIVLPQLVLGKGSQFKNTLPLITNLVAQLTGHDFSKLSKDDLAWFMAEHRAKRYVAAREPVAA